ncbi:TPA: hypothetical protein RQL07_000248 [Vibrio vulnificus]|nr:hypothetical protein [Vibrio vulnificus]HDY8087068.1 hypothetical protein [Vibrio vulnificus]HDY8109727.1 hypothetical protein [Vibrio vulnificus]
MTKNSYHLMYCQNHRVAIKTANKAKAHTKAIRRQLQWYSHEVRMSLAT